MHKNLIVKRASTDVETHLGTASAAGNVPNSPPVLGFSLLTLAEPVERVVTLIADTELMPRFQRVVVERKHDGTVVTEADRAVEAALVAALPTIFDCPVLGEEMPPLEQQRLWHEADWLWCVDPLDGTANFTAGKKYFGTSVALMYRRRSQFGLIFDPNSRDVFFAALGSGAYENGVRLVVKPSVPLQDAHCEIGRYKQLKLIGNLHSALRQHAPYRQSTQSGASVLQWCHMASGRTDIFIHAGERPWDYAAGALILEESGGAIATITNDNYWQTDNAEAMWDHSVIAARHPKLFDAWKRWVRRNC
jgi:myo-inositol-1(or 4)-monophosphatase